MAARASTTASTTCQAGATPSAIRPGIRIGANGGSSDSTVTVVPDGLPIIRLMPATNATMIVMLIGVSTDCSSSCRDTSDAAAANTVAYRKKPSRYQSTPVSRTAPPNALTSITSNADDSPRPTVEI